ncbi:hypothetical protein CDAR_126091 [Caerostris darwini]|uniref:Uncharacterized protein n=1 Tax=Caerostris darwini TaxID=1538125 RepID=A0AAV4SD93_9ARAC|nr:hypothetical protein CDAR_126091 [Caerostris darwini]
MHSCDGFCLRLRWNSVPKCWLLKRPVRNVQLFKTTLSSKERVQLFRASELGESISIARSAQKCRLIRRSVSPIKCKLGGNKNESVPSLAYLPTS